MPIGVGSSLFAVVLPVEKQNYFSNPNYEYGTAGGTAIAAAVIGTSSQYQQYGAWSLAVTPGVNGTAGVIAGTWAAQSGTPYTVSASIRADTAFYTMALADGAGLNFVASGSVDFQGGGTMHRYSITYTEASNTNRALVVRKNGGANILTFYIDGVQVEQGSVTTYFDGDTGGGTWLGAPHASQSVRSGQYRGGGSIVALGDLGLNVDQMLGVGVMPIEVSSQSYAVTPGAQFQRQRPGARQFTLTAKPISGTSLADFHVTRRTLYDAFKPDLVSPQQPVRLVYYGAQGTQFIDAYYQKGLELGNMDGPIAETLGVTFAAPDPYWYALTEQGTALAPRLNIGSVKFMAYRDSYGRWGTMGPSGSALNAAPTVIVPGANGLVYVGGAFGSAGGTRTRFIASWNPQTGAWGSLVGGTLNAAVEDMLLYPDGNLYVAGQFTQAAGTTANSIARYSPTLQQWGTTNGGGVDTARQIYGLALGQNGLLYAGGSFTTAAGTTANSIAQYNPITDRWGTMTTGVQTSVITPIFDVTTSMDGRIYIGGNFGTAGGTTTNNIAFWNPDTAQWGTMSTGVQIGGIAGNPFVEVIAQAPNGVLYAGGNFGSAGGGSAAYLAGWNGIQWTTVGQGSLNGQVSALVAENTGDLVIGGAFGSVGGLGGIPTRIVTYNGGAFLPFDADFDYPLSNIDLVAMAFSPDGTFYAGLSSGGGSAMVASVAQVVNTGRAEVYPTLRARAPSGGTAALYQFANTLTNDAIYFRNLVLQPGEIAELTLRPGARSFQSSSRGNILGRIAPGSNLSSWRLLPGTNYVSFFSDSDALNVSLIWQPVGHAIDSGTVF